jgi:hypothetical protein
MEHFNSDDLLLLSAQYSDQPNLAKGDEPLYTCALCGTPVFLVDKIVYKPCEHKDAAVLANMQAIVRGTSSVQ